MKVLVLVEQSGASRYWEGALPLLQQAGVDVMFATVRSTGEIHERLLRERIPSIGFGAESFRDYFRTARELAKLARQERFDLIHANESIPAFILGLSFLLGNRSKRLFHRHHNVATGVQRVMSFAASHMANLIMTVSKSSGEAARRYDLVSRKKICVAYSGISSMRPVSEAEVRGLRAKLGMPEKAKVISIVAHLREEKGHEELIRACATVAGAIEESLHLVIVGDGPFEGRLKELSAQFPQYTVHFCGHQSDIALWFSLADAVAMPSHHEAFGLAAVEAMACGRPLVASRVGGLAEVVEDGVSGLLFPARDEGALAQSLISVFNNSKLAEELGENARHRVESKFTIESMVRGWIDCYEHALVKGAVSE